MKWKLKFRLLEVSLMNFFLGMSKEIKRKVKVVLLGISLIIDELHTTDIQADQMEGESRVTRSILDELQSWDVQGDQMEGGSGVSGSNIDELHSSDIKRDQI